MATTITQADIQKARDYMPAETKEAVARLMAKLCVRTVENDAGQTIALPPMRVEDRLRRLQCLHGVLCGWYFNGKFEQEKLRVRGEDGKTVEQEIALCMSVPALNDWLSGHPIDQLERLKKEKQVANKVFDLLYDLRAFELMLNAAIREEIEMANDPALRIAQVLAMQATPEAMAETMDTLTRMREEHGHV